MSQRRRYRYKKDLIQESIQYKDKLHVIEIRNSFERKTEGVITFAEIKKTQELINDYDRFLAFHNAKINEKRIGIDWSDIKEELKKLDDESRIISKNKKGSGNGGTTTRRR